MPTATHQQQSASIHPLARRVPKPATMVAGDTACQLCAGIGAEPLLDLGRVPLLADVRDSSHRADTPNHPLRLVRCIRCGALQTDNVLDAADHLRIATAVGDRPFAGRPDLARRFCEDAIDRLALRGDGHVVEIGSGTGSLLRFFRAWQLPVLGIEPDERLTRYARLRRIPTWRAGFDGAIAQRITCAGIHADLVVISTPTGACTALRDLLTDAATILRAGGVATMELPDVLRIVGRTRVDEMSHAHRVLPTAGQLRHLAQACGLELVDIERSEPTQARLRVWFQRPPEHGTVTVHPRVRTRLRAESVASIDASDTIAAFTQRAHLVRDQIINLLDDARTQHCTVAVSGAGPTAVTLANMAGMSGSDIAYAIDTDPVRYGNTMPGTDIPIISPDQASAWRPDLVVALDDLPSSPDAWEGAPVYAVSDLIDVVHRLTGTVPPAPNDSVPDNGQLAS